MNLGDSCSFAHGAIPEVLDGLELERKILHDFHIARVVACARDNNCPSSRIRNLRDLLQLLAELSLDSQQQTFSHAPLYSAKLGWSTCSPWSTLLQSFCFPEILLVTLTVVSAEGMPANNSAFSNAR